ncbi:MAG TPA: heavy metal translocating P-type ATPase [Aquabacterium sp.]|nr:heavy metal translocating P-type ATPase [Aquabacterium sp.]HEX5374358.1 heavy metal translocating P-type ATPase [Aquabacterium sp.]
MVLSTPAAESGWREFRIATMDCSAEEADIRRALDKIDGIAALRFQLGARVLGIRASQAALPLALDAIRGAGYDPRPVTAALADASGAEHDHETAPQVSRLVWALVLALLAELIGFFSPDTVVFKGLGMAVAAAAIALAGMETYRKGWAALRMGKLNINALMTVAVSGAFVIGQWPEAAMVMALYALAELIEARSVDRARNAIQGLLDLSPRQADVQQADGSWRVTPVAEVRVGQRVRIRPGERVALDGVVLQGHSAVNQAPVTGESIPVDKAPGDEVYAGTINTSGELSITVSALVGDTTLARIIHAVEEAQGSRAPTQRFVDRFAAVYTPAVFVIAMAVAGGLPLLGMASWMEAAYKALVLLVIACPCALVISTPVSVVSALASAARRGILIKGGTYLEQARSLRVVAFDKTGTITQGQPRLVARQAWGDGDALRVDRLAASLAARSDHPVAQAIAQGLPGEFLDVTHVEALPGRGMRGQIGGQTLVLGNHRLIEELGLCHADLEARLQVHEAQGCTVTVLADGQRVLGVYAVSDTVKASAHEAMVELRALGVHCVMLTGDNQATAQAMALEAGIDEVQGHLLPQDKLAAIEALRSRHGTVAMTGDGINDAPALARADIGIAMGGAGTDTAMEAADVLIMNDDLRRIPELIRLSRRTHAVLWQNITLALGIKAVFLVLAVLGSASMWMAVFADMGASLMVVANGLRLLQGPRV